MTQETVNGEEVTSVDETLRFIATYSIPAKYKKVVVAALEASLRDEVIAGNARGGPTLETQAWRNEEVADLEMLLSGKIALNWQNADEMLISSARQLHRSQYDVKTKATELGLGAAVDYRLARAAAAKIAATT